MAVVNSVKNSLEDSSLRSVVVVVSLDLEEGFEGREKESFMIVGIGSPEH